MKGFFVGAPERSASVFEGQQQRIEAAPLSRSRWARAGIAGLVMIFIPVTGVLMVASASPAGASPADTSGDVYIADGDNNRIVKIPSGGGTQTVMSTGQSYPEGVAIDAVGNVYIAESNVDASHPNHRVMEVPADGSPQITIMTSSTPPSGIAVDAAGNVYVAGLSSNQVVKVPAGGGTQTLIGTGLLFPAGVAVDAAGNVYIADSDNDRIVKVPVGGGLQTAIGTDLSSPNGVAVDAAGNLYIADSGHARIVKVPAGGGAQTTFGTGLNHPTDVKIDAMGNVYVADFGNDRVVEVPAGGGAQTTVGSGLVSPIKVAVFAPPPALVSDTPPTSGTVNEAYAGYGYTATSPAGEPAAVFRVSTGSLPTGLSVDQKTGELTGIPTTAGRFTFQIQAGNLATADLGPSTTISISPGSQAITFTSTPPVSASAGNANYAVTATGGPSGNPVTFSSATPRVCVVTRAIVSFVWVGRCTINANQGGNGNYFPASQQRQSFVVARGAQNITFTSTPPAAASVGGETYTVTATGGMSENPVTFSSATPRVCGVTRAIVNFLRVGRCTINADQGGNPSYFPARQQQQSFAVAPGAQAITFTSTPPAAASVGEATYTVTATGGMSGNPVIFRSATPSACAVSGARVAFVGAGTCTVNADQPGNSSYFPARQQRQSFVVAPSRPYITVTHTTSAPPPPA